MPPLMTTSEWAQVLTQCGVKAAVVMLWADVFADTVREDSFSKGRAEIDDFLGQVLHESARLTHLSENMDYSAERLCVVWPKRFLTLADAQPYAHNPEALANKVYGGRMGNNCMGDGWRYRARGPIGLTGHDNYAFVGDLMGQDLIDLPELLEQPRFALEATIHWWEDRIPDAMLGDYEKVTQRVNGSLLGLADREELAQLARRALA